MKYSFKLLDISNFIEGLLSKLFENLLDKDKLLQKIFQIILNCEKRRFLLLMNA